MKMEDKTLTIVLPLTYVLLGGISINYPKEVCVNMTDNTPESEKFSFFDSEDKLKT